MHTTAPENWHGILRYGLKNASNTKLMTAGASYGSGIYLSPQGSMSLGYSMRGQGWMGYGGGGSGGGGGGLGVSLGGAATNAEGNSNAFLSSAGLTVLALCEVAKVPSLTKHAGGSVWVAPEEESVVTRFLFAFPGGIPPGECADNLNSQSESFESEVRHCLAGLGQLQDGFAL